MVGPSQSHNTYYYLRVPRYCYLLLPLLTCAPNCGVAAVFRGTGTTRRYTELLYRVRDHIATAAAASAAAARAPLGGVAAADGQQPPPEYCCVC